MRDGAPRIITAHPGFRLFLALDPRRGDISRAMRNRGVEVFLMPPPSTPAAEDDVNKEEEEEEMGDAAPIPCSVSMKVGDDGESKTEIGSRGGDGTSAAAAAATSRLSLPAPLRLPSARHTAAGDLDGVLAAAGVPAGAVRAAMAATHCALVSPPKHRAATANGKKDATAAAAAATAAAAAAAHTPREAARWAALSGELLARGVPAGNPEP